MKISFESRATQQQQAAVQNLIEQRGGRIVTEYSEEQRHLGIIAPQEAELLDAALLMPGVAAGQLIKAAARFASTEFKSTPSAVPVGSDAIGGDAFVVMAGPCSVESTEQMRLSAEAVAGAGAKLLRGGAFKPRTSPYDFQGMGEAGLLIMREAADEFGLGVVTEVMAAEDVALVAAYADLVQVGARNMQNFSLLKALGPCGKPILLKRGLSASIQELLMAAEYLVAHGSPGVVLCERGIRTFETATRNTCDISAVPVLAERTHFPVVVDPSHAAGKRSLVPALSKAAVAAGAAGLIIEAHPDPDRSVSDAAQTLSLETFGSLMKVLEPYVRLRDEERAQMGVATLA
jgi:3-deoxy-7-phosphoheptulonate synthase